MTKPCASLFATVLVCLIGSGAADAQTMPTAADPRAPVAQGASPSPAQAVPPPADISGQPATPAMAPGVPSEPTPVSALADRLDRVAEQLSVPNPTEDALTRARDELEEIRSEARKLMAAQVPNVATAQSELDALGPAPAEDGAPEAASVAAQRQALLTRLAEASAPVKQGELIVERASRMLADIGEIRRKRFTETIMARGLSPLSPTVWSRAFPVLTSIARSISGSVTDVLTSALLREKLRMSAIILAATIGMAVLLVWPINRWLLRRYGRNPGVEQPSFTHAVRATLVVGFAHALLPTAAAALVYFVAVSQGFLTDAGMEIGRAALQGIILFSVVVAFFRASLAPAMPGWRIVTVPSQFAAGVQSTIVALAFVFALDMVLSEIIVSYNARLAITSLRDYLLTVVVAVILIVPMLRQNMWIAGDDPAGQPRWRTLRILVALVLFQLLIMGALGYVTLARFAVSQLVLTGGLGFLVLILHRLGREFIRNIVSRQTWVGSGLRTSLHMDEASTRRFEFWVGLAHDTVLGLAGLVVGMFVWGADRDDVAEWVYRVLFGFKIGQMTFSLVNLAMALAVFIALLIASRFIQRMLAEKIMPQTRFDAGLRQSIPTAFGYAGIVFAAAAGITAMGFDLSNLAIVAGALSVGVGFGLQNVVNNFVSGLILLAERPIKVGDWIIVGDKEGYVNRINVRATEIQTFDRSTVFVPNSQLISDAVTNWTYADKLGRVIIPVGVAYGSDTKLVRDTLLEIAKAHDSVLTYPEPMAVFRGFGDSSLNFELRCFLQNVEMTIIVTSDLCFAIDDAFRAKGIEIPFPQRDVHLRQAITPEASDGLPPSP